MTRLTPLTPLATRVSPIGDDPLPKWVRVECQDARGTVPMILSDVRAFELAGNLWRALGVPQGGQLKVKMREPRA